MTQSPYGIEEATAPPTDAEEAQARAVADPYLDDLYPKPTQGDIESLWNYQKSQWTTVHTQITDQRDIRFGRDQTPDKWASKLSGNRRVRTRWSNNEVLRVSATLGRNPPKIKVPVAPGKRGTGAADKAAAQTMFGNRLIRALEKQAGGALWRPLLDAAASDGLVGIEFYMKENSSYDAINFDPQEIYDAKLGDYREETPAEVNRRVDQQLVMAALPFGIRAVDPVAMYAELDEEGYPCRMIIAEWKPYRTVYEKQTATAQQTGTIRDPRLPKPGTPGWPVFSSTPPGLSQDTDSWASQFLTGQSNAQETVLTLRYYDRRWMAYIVGGVLVNGPVEHKLPCLPVVLFEGITTGSSNIHERYQGITTGLAGIELAFNDLLTLALDEAYTYNRPRPYVYTPAGVNFSRSGQMLNLSGTDDAPYLDPGQEVRDAFATFKTQFPEHMLAALQGILQHNGLNPIAQGQSPGSDTAGYTANTLTQAALSQYEVILDNFARVVAWIVDLARKVVRDVVKESVLGLSPDDVDDTPSEVTVDPLSDANRIAMTQAIAQLNKMGFVSRRRVQEAAGIEDTDQEDSDIVVDAATEELANLAIELAKGIVAGTIVKNPQGQYVSAAPQSPQEPGQTAAPTGPTSSAPPPQAPAVGAQMAQAQQRQVFGTKPGPAAQQPSTARAGQAQTVRRM